MTKAKKSAEQFIAQGPLAESLIKDKDDSLFERNLAAGALRFVAINGEAQSHRKLGNNESKVSEVLNHKTLVGGGILADNPEFIEYDIEYNLIDPTDIPESYFKLQQKIARERGHGDIEITPALREMAAETLQDDQRESLTKWADYLRDETNRQSYPDWFKVYTWESVKRLGDFDKKKQRFDKRSLTTTGLYPELDPEALAYVYDNINTHVLSGAKSEDEVLSRLLESANFGRLYAHAIEQAGIGISPEQRKSIKGSWKKYNQIEGYNPDYAFDQYGEATEDPTATELAESLQGHQTGWCTAGNRTAAHQLSQGDFYVYYSDDGEGKDTIPRIAIRMENGQVAEVRGIEPGQNLEGNMEDILLEKLKELPGGDTYFTKVENMRRLTDIDERVQAGGELTGEDILFLRFSGDIEGFGWRKDPRIKQLVIKGRRGVDDDVLTILRSSTIDPTALAHRLIDKGSDDDDDDIIAYNLDTFFAAGVDPTDLAHRLIDKGRDDDIANSLDKLLAAGVDPAALAHRLIDKGRSHLVAYNLDTFLAAGVDPAALAHRLIDKGRSHLVAYNLDTFLAAGANEDQIDRWLYPRG